MGGCTWFLVGAARDWPVQIEQPYVSSDALLHYWFVHFIDRACMLLC
jgi:hypothetical protein